ncbi:MAG: TetR/AcrR family transcriptional regulator [Thermoleophilia bacterium]|nr:TetR/AcrR family transcriptional regulator [Thermoleophilia bacterium]
MEPTAVLPHIPSRTTNEELAEEKRLLIGEAAIRCFGQGGFHATTIEQIATEAGMSVGLIYRYVKRKEDILLVAIDQSLSLYESALIPIARLDLPPAEKLRQAMFAYYGIIDRKPDRAAITYRETWVLDKAGRDYVKQRELETNRHIERIIQEGIDRGVFRTVDPHFITYDIALLGHMWALKGWHFRALMSHEEYVQKQFELVMAYLRPPGADQVDGVESSAASS